MGPNLQPSEVAELLQQDMASLHPKYRTALERALITPRKVHVVDFPGEYVIAVADFGGKLLYWSEFEEGWEIGMPDTHGNIATRGSNQFELGQALYQQLGPADAA